MKNTLIKDFGWIAYFKDYVKLHHLIDDDGDSIIETESTNSLELAKLEGFNRRQIGIHKTYDDNFVVAVAVCPLDDSTYTNRSGKTVISSRIITYVKNGLHHTPRNIGVTHVPVNYLHLLVEDPFTYDGLYGPLNSDDLLKTVAVLKTSSDKFIKRQISLCYTEKRLKEQDIKEVHKV